MTLERFEELFDITESELSKYKSCNAVLGLNIISKYTNKGIQAAEHDIIYSASIEELIENDITEEDVIELRKLNWSIDQENESLCCFV